MRILEQILDEFRSSNKTMLNSESTSKYQGTDFSSFYKKGTFSLKIHQ